VGRYEITGRGQDGPLKVGGRWTEGQWPTVQCDAVPGDALHVRHPGIVIEARMVVLVLRDDGENTRRRLAAGGAGRHWRAQDPALGVVESDLLAVREA